MRLHFLTDSVQRSLGAMLMRDLKEDVLAFIYPSAVARTFHTFFCPPLRIVALNAQGEILFDEVITKWRFVKLPACQYVIETAPKVNYQPFIPTIIKVAPDLPQTGALDPSLRMDSLLFALLAEAVADIRRIREAHPGKVQPAVQRRKFEVWERGQIVSSAGFLLDFSRAWNLPVGAVRLSHAVLAAEEPYLEELVAASVAGVPWRQAFPNACMRCGKPGSWRSILQPNPRTPVEHTWRYQRPENAVPLCHHCTETLELLRRADLQFDLAWGLWGPRFEALWQWHQAFQEKRLPDWDSCNDPLWPPEYGGKTWESGSGSLKDVEPRPPYGIQRSEQHLAALRRVLFSRKFRGRQPGETHLQRLLHSRIEGD
ncbi:MAG: hypothetical protein QY329_08210 [Anaerolineales bacterium]|nr:MAG: hypothetical protein QY329_08210 [Anaerolineales bacterium]